MANINQRLNGLTPLSYLGDNAVQPPDFITKPRPPNSTDSKNMYLGNLWLDTSGYPNVAPTNQNIWMLVALIGNQATWVNLAAATGILTLTGNSGGVVSADGADNINIVGTGTISVVGNPGAHSLTVTPSGSIASSFITNPATATATPVAGVLTFAGTGGITVSAAGSTVTVDGTGAAGVTTLTGNSGGAVPATAGNINVVGTGTISVAGNPGTSTLTVTPSGSIASSFITNPATGTATPAAGVLTFAGAGSTTVSAAGSTVTITSTGGGGASTCNFRAYANSRIANITGDGTQATVVFPLTLFNVGGNYNTGTGVFTAPVTGYYTFLQSIIWDGIDASTTQGGFITYNKNGGGGENHNSCDFNIRAISVSGGATPNTATTESSITIQMNAGDTMQLLAQYGGGGKTVSVAAGNNAASPAIYNNWFCGYQIA